MYMQMYSLTAVGGIQYTTEMAKSKMNMKSTARKSNNRDGLRTQIREEIVIGGSSTPGTAAMTATLVGNNTSVNGYAILTPAGLTGAVLTAGTPNTYTAGTTGNIDSPHLRKLYNLAIDFKGYRVLNGRLIFTPNVGSTTPGQLVMTSSRDPLDASPVPQVAYATGDSYRVFNLSMVTKEMSIPLDVDPSWKKITSVLNGPASNVPANGSAAMLSSFNTISDLAFSSISWTLVNSANAITTNYGVFSVVYEVEFKGLIDSTVNA